MCCCSDVHANRLTDKRKCNGNIDVSADQQSRNIAANQESSLNAANQVDVLMQVNGKPLYVAIAQKKVDRQRRLKTYFQQPQANYQNPQGGPGGYMPGPFYGPGKLSCASCPAK